MGRAFVFFLSIALWGHTTAFASVNRISQEQYEEAAHLHTQAQVKKFMLETNLRMAFGLHDCICTAYPALQNRPECRGRETRELQVASILASAHIRYDSERCQSLINRLMLRPLSDSFAEMRKALALMNIEASPRPSRENPHQALPGVININISHNIGREFSANKDPIAALAPLSATEQAEVFSEYQNYRAEKCVELTRQAPRALLLMQRQQNISAEDYCQNYILRTDASRPSNNHEVLAGIIEFRRLFTAYFIRKMHTEHKEHWSEAYRNIVNQFPGIVFFANTGPSQTQVLNVVNILINNARKSLQDFQEIFTQRYAALNPRRIHQIFLEYNDPMFRPNVEAGSLYGTLYEDLKDVIFGSAYTDAFFRRDYPQLSSRVEAIRDRVKRNMESRHLFEAIGESVLLVGGSSVCFLVSEGFATGVCFFTINSILSASMILESAAQYKREMRDLLGVVEQNYSITDMSHMQQAQKDLFLSEAMTVLAFGIDAHIMLRLARAR